MRDDDTVKAVVLTGSGGHFCVGGDIKSISRALAEGRDGFEGRDSAFHREAARRLVDKQPALYQWD